MVLGLFQSIWYQPFQQTRSPALMASNGNLAILLRKDGLWTMQSFTRKPAASPMCQVLENPQRKRRSKVKSHTE